MQDPSLIMQNQVGEQFCSYGQMSVVVDQSHFSESVHEVSVEKLIAEIFFEIDIAGDQQSYEFFRKLRVIMERTKHCQPFDLTRYISSHLPHATDRRLRRSRTP